MKDFKLVAISSFVKDMIIFYSCNACFKYIAIIKHIKQLIIWYINPHTLDQIS